MRRLLTPSRLFYSLGLVAVLAVVLAVSIEAATDRFVAMLTLGLCGAVAGGYLLLRRRARQSVRERVRRLRDL